MLVTGPKRSAKEFLSKWMKQPAQNDRLQHAVQVDEPSLGREVSGAKIAAASIENEVTSGIWDK